MVNCPKLNSCPKILMVLDKDLSLDWLYAKAIKQICNQCEEDKMTLPPFNGYHFCPKWHLLSE